MKYMTMMHGEEKSEEISKERARELLEGCYIADAVADVFDNDKAFRLRTPYRDIWTKTDDGLVPMPGFYGVVG